MFGRRRPVCCGLLQVDPKQTGSAEDMTRSSCNHPGRDHQQRRHRQPNHWRGTRGRRQEDPRGSREVGARRRHLRLACLRQLRQVARGRGHGRDSTVRCAAGKCCAGAHGLVQWGRGRVREASQWAGSMRWFARIRGPAFLPRSS